MNHISLNPALESHPNTIRLSFIIGDRAFITLVRLMSWASQNQPHGLVTQLGAQIIEHALKWDGEPGELFAALKASGVIDEIGIVGWWDDHKGYYFKHRKTEAIAEYDILRAQAIEQAIKRGAWDSPEEPAPAELSPPPSREDEDFHIPHMLYTDVRQSDSQLTLEGTDMAKDKTGNASARDIAMGKLEGLENPLAWTNENGEKMSAVIYAMWSSYTNKTSKPSKANIRLIEKSIVDNGPRETLMAVIGMSKSLWHSKNNQPKTLKSAFENCERFAEQGREWLREVKSQAAKAREMAEKKLDGDGSQDESGLGFSDHMQRVRDGLR